MKEITKFKTGETYHTRSICNHECIFSFEILRRTAKSVWVKYHGRTTRRGVKVRDGVEWCSPHGTYSMSPVITANDTSC